MNNSVCGVEPTVSGEILEELKRMSFNEICSLVDIGIIAAAKECFQRGLMKNAPPRQSMNTKTCNKATFIHDWWHPRCTICKKSNSLIPQSSLLTQSLQELNDCRYTLYFLVIGCLFLLYIAQLQRSFYCRQKVHSTIRNQVAKGDNPK